MITMTPPDRGSLAANLTHWRDKRGLSQKDLAARAGVAPNSVSRWENGRPLRTTELVSVCRVLQVSADELLGLRGKAMAQRKASLYFIDPAARESVRQARTRADLEAAGDPGVVVPIDVVEVTPDEYDRFLEEIAQARERVLAAEREQKSGRGRKMRGQSDRR